MKKLFLSFVLLTMTILPFIAIAAVDDYKMLAPIQQLTGGGSSVDLGTYIPNMIKLIIGLASALAVIKIIIGGIQYMSTDAVGGKSDGKETIQNALLGLLLAISAYTILYTVNPKLLDINLSIDRQAVGEAFDFNLGTDPDGLGGDAGRTGDPTNWVAGASWGDDTNIRDMLFINKPGSKISINHADNCKNIGQPNCTSLTGLAPAIVVDVKLIQGYCGCNIRITGGTEFWLHQQGTAHRPGGNVLDFSLDQPDTSFSDYIRKLPEYKAGPGDPVCAPGPAYKFTLAGKDVVFVDEKIAGNPPHWHTCFYK